MKEEEIKGPKELTEINKEKENENGSDVRIHAFLFRNTSEIVYRLRI